MVLNSEAKALQHVTAPPRDRKYVMVAYSRLLSEHGSQMQADTQKALACGLIEMASQSSSVGFVRAGMVEKSAEELLMDGAVD